VRPRGTALLAGLVVAGPSLVCGGVLLLLGPSSGAARVGGIVAAVLGLACLRVVFWVRRARLMTRVGMSLRDGAADDQVRRTLDP
jgi:hypothetical protein